MSMSLNARIIQYEDEGLSPLETIKLFQDLVNSGLAYELGGTYLNGARHMIDLGLITHADELDPDFESDSYQEVA